MGGSNFGAVERQQGGSGAIAGNRQESYELPVPQAPLVIGRRPEECRFAFRATGRRFAINEIFDSFSVLLTHFLSQCQVAN